MNNRQNTAGSLGRTYGPGALGLKRPGKKILLLLFVSLAVITIVTFSPAFKAGLVSIDDQRFITENKMIKELSLENVRKMFRTSESEHLFIPLVWLSYAVEIALFGERPEVFHTVNVLLHLANVFLVLVLVFKLTDSIAASLVTAVFFAVHPMRVESVVWVTERKDVLSTFFMLCALIFYTNYLARDRRIHYAAALASFILASMAKPMVVMVPVLMMLMDYFKGEPFRSKRRLLEKVPFFALSILIAVLTIAAQSEFALSRKKVMHVGANIMIAMDNVIFYISKFFAPVKLSPFYPKPDPAEGLSADYLISAFIFAALLICALISLKWTKKVFFGYLFFLLSLVPVIQLIPVGFQNAADRFTYVPYIGLFMIVGFGVDLILQKSRQRWLPLTACLLCLILFAGASFLSFRRSRIWSSNEKLWFDVLRKYPDSAIANESIGGLILAQGEILQEPKAKEKKYREAEKYLRRAIELDGHSLDAYCGMGVIMLRRGRKEEAREFFEKTIEVEPRYLRGYHALAKMRQEDEDFEGAIEMLEKMLAVKENEQIHEEVGGLYLKIRNYAKGLYHSEKALEMNPENIAARINKGSAYVSLGLYDKAIKEFELAARIDPQAYDAYQNIATVYIRKGQPEEALVFLEKALAIKADDYVTYLKIASAYEQKGAYEDALNALNRALGLEITEEVRRHLEASKQELVKKMKEQKSGGM